MFNFIAFIKTPAFSAGVLFYLFMTGSASAQDPTAQSNFEHKIIVYNVNGQPMVNPYVDVAGTPFFLVPWKYGTLEMSDHAKFNNLSLRLDLQSQEVHYQKNDNTEMIIQAGSVRRITLVDSLGKSPVSYAFQCGFPPIDNQNEKNFYQILSDGKIKFLKSLRKSIHEDKDSFSGEVKKEFRLYEDYYFFVNDKLERIKKDKGYILGFMKDKVDQVGAFLQSTNVSFKSVDDIKRLVDYYNTL
jgi:hypothetical protein